MYYVRNQQIYTIDNHNEIKEGHFFCWFFIKDLLMLHKLHCLNLLGQIWRT